LKIEDIIKKYVKKSKIPGISVGLIDKDGTQFFNYGEIKKESGIEPTNDILYEIGSMTKTFTAILATQLQKEGMLSLDDPIVKFLPEFVGSEFDKNNITLYHLITHTSGIVEVPLRNYPQLLIKIIFRTSKGRLFPPRYSYNTSDFLQEVSKLRLKNNPGIKFRYSNTGVGLVGKILERATNTEFEKLVKNHIFDVLDMKDTGINIRDTHVGKLATGYLYTGKESDPIYLPAVMSAGSICSTTSDLLKFLKTNLGLSESSLSQILEYCKLTKINPQFSSYQKFMSKLFYGTKSTEIGLGWMIANLADMKIISHGGGTEGFSTLMMMNLEEKTGVVILSNVAMRDHFKLGVNLLKTIIEK